VTVCLGTAYSGSVKRRIALSEGLLGDGPSSLLGCLIVICDDCLLPGGCLGYHVYRARSSGSVPRRSGSGCEPRTQWQARKPGFEGAMELAQASGLIILNTPAKVGHLLNPLPNLDPMVVDAFKNHLDT
jgi:hypothetical protein